MKLEGGPTEPLVTLHLMSDGMLLYWLYMLRTQETVSHAVTGEKVKQHSVYLQALEIKVCVCACVRECVRECVCVHTYVCEALYCSPITNIWNL